MLTYKFKMPSAKPPLMTAKVKAAPYNKNANLNLRADIKYMLSQGMTQVQMADELGVKKGAISSQLKRMGIRIK